jgi:hypothetical protein
MDERRNGYVEIHGRLAAMEEHLKLRHAQSSQFADEVRDSFKDLDHKLFGNGQPGEFDKIKSRLSHLEHWKWYVMGFAAAAALLGGSILKGILK